jgi:short subunit dehydrogenase-like uncharacterized protein
MSLEDAESPDIQQLQGETTQTQQGKRPYDFLVIGATGFTGRRTARVLLEECPDPARVALAARNQERLLALAKEVGVEEKNCFQLDTTDVARVQQIIPTSRMVVSTAGPYSLYGEAVLAACAASGTHYTDITGEVDFIAEMAQKYGKEAQSSGARLVSFCGFDSVPAEVAVHTLAKRFSQGNESDESGGGKNGDKGDELSIQSYYQTRGGLNGGTIATMLNKLATSGNNQKVQPDALIPESQRAHGPKLKAPKGAQFFGFVRRIARWSTPFIMSGVNARVVYRSVQQMHESKAYNFSSFGYSEQSSLGKWYAPWSFLLTTKLLLSLAILGPFAWFRKLLSWFVPKPGQGPSEESIESGFFRMRVFAENTSGQKEEISCFFAGDPSNKATVFFLVHSSVLLLELEQLNQLASPGFHTPYTAFGDHLAQRLEQKGYQIDI